jgi:hypothetical protein
MPRPGFYIGVEDSCVYSYVLEQIGVFISYSPLAIEEVHDLQQLPVLAALDARYLFVYLFDQHG